MKNYVYLAVLAALGSYASTSFAHTPLFSCFEDGDHILCEGGFSDGSSAANVPVIVRGADGNVVHEGKIDENSEFTFDKPEGDYTVTFDGGEGHRIELKSGDIN